MPEPVAVERADDVARPGVGFPLVLVALATRNQLGSWFWPAIGLAGLVGAVYVFCRAWSPDTRDLDRF